MSVFLKWAGGKRKIADRIGSCFPGRCGCRWIEPFCGSASVFFHRQDMGLVGEAILSDRNARLVALFVSLRDEVGSVIDRLSDREAFPIREGSWARRYEAIRNDFNDLEQGGPLLAARFLWLNRACFNGLYRENRRGRFNVPVGGYEDLALPTDSLLRGASKILQGVDLRCAPFEEVLAEAGAGDHVYCDPPYWPLSKTSSFTAYDAGGFGAGDQERLAHRASEAADRGAVVVCSNHDVPEIRSLYGDLGFELREFEARRSVGAKSRGMARELLAVRGGATSSD